MNNEWTYQAKFLWITPKYLCDYWSFAFAIFQLVLNHGAFALPLREPIHHNPVSWYKFWSLIERRADLIKTFIPVNITSGFPYLAIIFRKGGSVTSYNGAKTMHGCLIEFQNPFRIFCIGHSSISCMAIVNGVYLMLRVISNARATISRHVSSDDTDCGPHMHHWISNFECHILAFSWIP
jgi:hypothetical protein